MAILLKYVLADGLIVGQWEGNTAASVEVQRVRDDPDYGYLGVASDAPHGQLAPADLQRLWYVDQGQLVEKPLVTITADPNPFMSVGQQTTAITVTPFVECTLMILGVTYTLTAADPVLEFDADAPGVFAVRMAPQAHVWGEPLIVEAT